tara:strand:+ start:1458 stop:3209 length:1752 start_codon:yes stop_codon:yes gene_type:complete
MNNYTWNIKSIYKSQKDWDLDLEKFKSGVLEYEKKVIDIDSVRTLKRALLVEKRLDKLYSKLFMYILLKVELQPKNEDNKFKETELNNMVSQYSYVSLELDQKIKKLNQTYKQKLTANKELKFFWPRIEQVLNIKRRLSYKSEKLMSKFESLKERFPSLYNNIVNKHISFQDITTDDGNLKKVKYTNIKNLEGSADANVRRRTYYSKRRAIEKTAGSFSQTLNGFLQFNKIFAHMEKYNSLVDFCLYEDGIKENQVVNVLETIKSNKYIIEELTAIKKRDMGIKKYYSYDDAYAPMQKKINISKTMKDIKEASLVFENGSEKIINDLVKERKVKILTKPEVNLSYEGFSIGMRDVGPYVFSYYKRDVSSAMTLAHELGHAIHEVKINKANDQWNSMSTLLVAEIISYTYEIGYLLNNIRNAKSRKTQKKWMLELMNYYYSCLYKKGFHTQYELELYKKTENNESFNPKDLSESYESIRSEYFDGIHEKTKYSSREWVGFNRLLWDFYEFKYIIAFSLASKISAKVYEGNKFYIKQFDNLLKAGYSSSTKDILKEFGVNFSSIESVVEEAFSRLEEIVQEYKIL